MTAPAGTTPTEAAFRPPASESAAFLSVRGAAGGRESADGGPCIARAWSPSLRMYLPALPPPAILNLAERKNLLGEPLRGDLAVALLDLDSDGAAA